MGLPASNILHHMAARDNIVIIITISLSEHTQTRTEIKQSGYLKIKQDIMGHMTLNAIM